MKEIYKKLEERLTEIGLVFEKANENEMISSMIERLKVNALSEAKVLYKYLTIDNKPISKRKFDSFSAGEKADVICMLGSIGIKEFIPDIIGSKIKITFSAHLQNVLSCTMLVLLNKLENLDGAINAILPEVRITVQAPIGGKKGLTKCYMLIQLLYPWCKGISETSTNEVSVTMPIPKSDVLSNKKKCKDLKNNKSSFWKKILRRLLR